MMNKLLKTLPGWKANIEILKELSKLPSYHTKENDKIIEEAYNRNPDLRIDYKDDKIKIDGLGYHIGRLPDDSWGVKKWGIVCEYKGTKKVSNTLLYVDSEDNLSVRILLTKAHIHDDDLDYLSFIIAYLAKKKWIVPDYDEVFTNGTGEA